MLLIIVVFGKLFLQCRKLNIRLIPQSLNRGKAVPGGVCGFWDNWGLDDPTGKSDDDFKAVIQRIEENIFELKKRLSENK